MTRAREDSLRAAIAFGCALLVAIPTFGFTTREEIALGHRFALEARARLPLVRDIEIVSYVDEIGQKIVTALGDQPFVYHFSVIRDDNVNAFAVPGGHIYVHAGLLANATNDDEVAGVLGHEIAHVNAHHLARQQQATSYMNYTTLLGVLLSVIQPAIGAGALAAQAAAKLEYSRAFEQEADFLGARYMAEAGYRPIGMLDFFKKLHDRHAVSAAAGVPPYLLSHPLTADRLTNLEAVLQQRQWQGSDRRAKSLKLERVQLLTAIRSGRPEDALAAYRKRATEAPDDPRAQYLLGLALFEMGLLEAAADKLQEAARSGFPEADRELGRTLFRQRRSADAVPLLEAAAKRNPRDPVAQYSLGEAWEELQQPEKAKAAYRACLAGAPDMDVAHEAIGRLAGRSGDRAEGFYHLARAASLRGEYAKALDQFSRAEKLAAHDSPLAQRIRLARAELKNLPKRREPEDDENR